VPSVLGSYFWQIKRFIIIVVFSLFLVFPQDCHSSEKRVVLALSGGGAKGFAHIGVLKALEEANIPIAGICGVSMGAVVGALYAIGYDTHTIHRIASTTDWGLFYDDSPTRDLTSIEEKRDFNRYLTSFPIKGGRIEIPQGISAGQNIGRYLSRLSWPVHHVNDFSNFSIPFSAVATNLLTGQAEQFTKGNLAEILQASITIPSILTPVEIDSQLYIDGGVSRNLPVDFARNMGGDIVIAVDVTAPLYTKSELNSGMKIVDQSISFRGYENTQKQRKLADILIEPDMNGLGNKSFTKDEIDTIITRGYLAAKGKLPEINRLIGERSAIKQIKSSPLILDSLYITEIKIEGAKQVNAKFVRGKLNVRTPCWMTATQIEEAIDRVYASRYFHRVNYRLIPIRGNQTLLVVHVVEQSMHTFNIGIHYSDYTKATLLLNVSYRNIFRQNSKLSADLMLGENPGSTINYFLHTNWKPGIGIEILLLNRRFQIYQYQDGNCIGQNELYYSGGELALKSNIFNNFSIGGAIRGEQADIKQVISQQTTNLSKYSVSALNNSFIVQFDNVDDLYFPSKGARWTLSMSYISQISTADTSLRYQPYQKNYFHFTDAILIGKRLVMLRRLSVGSINSSNIPALHGFHIGGMGHFQEHTPNYFPFVGYNFMELSGPHFITLGGGIRVEMWKNNFLIAQADWGSAHKTLDEFYEFSQYRFGAALTFAYRSPAGPIALSIMRSTSRAEYLTFVNLGFQF